MKNSVLKNLIYGIKYQYPICCVLDFVINNFNEKYKNVKRNEYIQEKGIKVGYSSCNRCYKKLLKKHNLCDPQN